MSLDILKNIKGIGEARLNKLIQAGFDTLGKLKQASLEEISTKANIPRRYVNDIKKFLLRLDLKSQIKSKWKPNFRRQDSHKKPSLGDSWRKPKGKHSKLREHRRAKGAWVQVGYRTPRRIRGLHPSGYREVLVHNPNQLQGLDPILDAVRIASSVGARKRKLILEEAQKLGIKVLNA